MDKSIQDLTIRVSGKFPIEKQLELGKEYSLNFIVGVVKQEVYDNNDGSVNINYVVKPIEGKLFTKGE